MIGFWNLLLLINAVLFLNYCVSCSDFERLIYVTGNERSLNSVAENYQKIDIASPQCYTTNKYGELSGGVDPILQKLSDEGKIKLLPLVMNKGFDDEILTVLLRNQTAQDLLLGSLVKEAKKHNFIGWQYDFEHLLITNRDVYTQFVAKSNLRFKQEKLNFSICVCPRSKDYTGSDPYLKFMWEEWNGGYDFLQLSKHVDFLAYMTYSEHTGATVSGPIASINWVQACVNFALSLGVPASKLSLGIPFYHGYWKTVFDKNKGIHVNGSSPSYLEILKILKDNNASLEWDTNYKVNKASFMIDYKSHHVFVEDKDSLVVKLLVLKDNNLRGICCWVAGQEDPAVWDVLSLNAKNHQTFPTTHHTNFPRYTNRDLRETIQTKKTLTKKYKKKQYFLCLTWIMLFQKQFEETISSYSWWEIYFKEKQQEPNKKQEKHSTPFLWINLVDELLEQNKEPNIQKS